ncbi:energy transducer TonB [Microbulbifer sp. THAF38]|uniref:energy transducer TonB n=1 Tax=Microbulbifer sp. THAF38 TaxID=2587856 RepID=UPI001268ADEE|nr:energy transducer TonB [Microbulbifer sp. THAF38]QFT55414.1 transport protein TonB [Microbulbifer sp. THAF38]
MSLLAGPKVVSARRPRFFLSLCAFCCALALHGLIAAYFLWQPKSELALPPAAAPQVFEVSMVAAPVAPATSLPVGPQQQESSPANQQRSEPQKTTAQPEPVILPEAPSDIAIEKPEEEPPTEDKEDSPELVEEREVAHQQDSSGEATGETVIEETSAPLAAEVPEAEQAAAPEVGTLNQRESQARLTWQNQLQAHLERRKRYPRSAQIRRQQGIPWVRFTIDRQGKVLNVELHKPSGFATLDREVVALVRRAEPLPKPPQDIPGATLTMAVPIEFFIR